MRPLARFSLPGQAMIETVIAVLVVMFLFLCLFRLSYMLEGKILLEHAAMRVARARSVGLNDFMCEKTARVSVIPVAGKRLWPLGDELDYEMERARVPIYLATPTPPVARGVLEYAGWNRMSVVPGNGTDSRITLGFSLFEEEDGTGADTFKFTGEAGVEEHASLYLNNMWQ